MGMPVNLKEQSDSLHFSKHGVRFLNLRSYDIMQTPFY